MTKGLSEYYKMCDVSKNNFFGKNSLSVKTEYMYNDFSMCS